MLLFTARTPLLGVSVDRPMSEGDGDLEANKLREGELEYFGCRDWNIKGRDGDGENGSTTDANLIPKT